ncbi:MAG: glycosyltransferase family 4 protein [Patescibacteria group bacterium]
MNKLIPAFNYKVVTLESISLKKPFGLFYFLIRLRKILKDFDIVHALDGWPHGFLATLATIGLKKKVIITLIGTGSIQPMYHFPHKLIMKWVYKRADRLVAVSQNTKKEILKIIPSLKIEVINHGVDFDKYQTLNIKNKNDAEIQRLKPYILSVGTLKKRKGYEYSVRAFAEVAEKFPELKYVIVGQGHEEENLKSQISKLKIEDKIIFLNYLSEEFLVALYHNAELFILLSQDNGKDIEGFGLVFLEAASCGLPIVATLETGAADAVSDGKNGILVPTRDSHKATQAIIKILLNSNLKNSFSESSLEFAKSMNWEKVADSYFKIYKF